MTAYSLDGHRKRIVKGVGSSLFAPALAHILRPKIVIIVSHSLTLRLTSTVFGSKWLNIYKAKNDICCVKNSIMNTFC